MGEVAGGLVSEQEQSSQSVAAFCGACGLSRSYFYCWKRRLQEASRPQLVEAQVVKANPDKRPSRSTLGPTIEVRLSNGRSLVVRPEFDASHFAGLAERGGIMIGLPSLHNWTMRKRRASG